MIIASIGYVGIISITYYVTALVQTILHRYLGHLPTLRSSYQAHTYSHHVIYSANRFVSNGYSAEEQSVTWGFAMPAALLALVAYVLLPLSLFAACIGTIVLSYAAHVYLHAQYHLDKTWLQAFGWFSKKRGLHLVHHRDFSHNYAVVEFFWDRVMGTYLDAPPYGEDGIQMTQIIFASGLGHAREARPVALGDGQSGRSAPKSDCARRDHQGTFP